MHCPLGKCMARPHSRRQLHLHSAGAIADLAPSNVPMSHAPIPLAMRRPGQACQVTSRHHCEIPAAYHSSCDVRTHAEGPICHGLQNLLALLCCALGVVGAR